MIVCSTVHSRIKILSEKQLGLLSRWKMSCDKPPEHGLISLGCCTPSSLALNPLHAAHSHKGLEGSGRNDLL